MNHRARENQEKSQTPIEAADAGVRPNSLALGTEQAPAGDIEPHAIFRTFINGAAAERDAAGLLPFGGKGRAEHIGIWIKTGGNEPFFGLATKLTAGLLPRDGSRFFPVYVYEPDSSIRRENITDWALDRFREHYREPVISKWSIFDYVYGVLHHPGYRGEFANNLHLELPRIPFAPDFRAFQRAGQTLIELHLHYEKLEPWELEFVQTPGMPTSDRVQDKMRLSEDRTRLTVSPSLTLAGIPPEAFDYRLGNRSALEWLIDPYPLRADSRPGITSDPDCPDNQQSIARLVGQVIRVSIETLKVINVLPQSFTDAESAKAG